MTHFSIQILCVTPDVNVIQKLHESYAGGGGVYVKQARR